MSDQRYSFTRSFQESVVALMCREPHFLDHYGDVLRPEYFTKDDLSCLARLVLDYYAVYKQPPQKLTDLIVQYAKKIYPSSSQQAQVLASPLLSLADRLVSMDLSDASFVTESISKFGKFHSLTSALQASLEVALQDDTPTGETFDTVRAIIDKALAVGKGSSKNLVSGAALRTLLDRNQKRVAARVPSGYKRLDADLNGGLGAGEVGTFIADSGVGKSIIQGQILVNSVLTGHPSLYVTCELDEDQVLNRIGACLVGMDAGDLENPTPEIREEYDQRLEEVLGSHENFDSLFKIQYYSPKSASTGTIRSLLSHLRAREKFEPQLLVVDYADELRPDSIYRGDDSNTYLQMGSVYKSLRGLGKEFGFPTWTASQYNREGAKISKAGPGHVADKFHLADSYMKVAVSDLVITVNQSSDEHNDGTARLFTAKVRRGPSNKIYDVNINYSMMRVTESQFQVSHAHHFDEELGEAA